MELTGVPGRCPGGAREVPVTALTRVLCPGLKVLSGVSRASDAPAGTGERALPCAGSVALTGNTGLQNKGGALYRFCCLIIESVRIYFRKLP